MIAKRLLRAASSLITLFLISAAPKSSDGAAPPTSQHYELLRDVLKFEVTGAAPVRIRCTATRKGEPVEGTIVWDPNERRGPIRYLLLPLAKLGSAEYAISCQSDSIDQSSVVNNVTSTTTYHYVFRQTAAGSGPWSVSGQMVSITGPQSITTPTLAIAVSRLDANEPEREKVLRQRYDILPTTRLRSLDPVTPFVSDALTALASIALERAEEAGKSYARELLVDNLCTSMSVKNVRKMAGSALAKAIDGLRLEDDKPLLSNTCTILESVRFDELAASGHALWRALAADAVALGIGIVGSAVREPNAPTDPIVLQHVNKSIVDVLNGNTATTERDVQALLLELGRVGFYASSPSGWQCGLEMGFAVLHECMRVGECSADAVVRLLDEERIASETIASANGSCKAAAALQSWPALPALLSRAVDVLRPPPGTPAKITAVTALQLVLDVISKRLASNFETLSLKEGALLPSLSLKALGEALPKGCDDQARNDVGNLKASASPELIQQATASLRSASCLGPAPPAWATNLEELAKVRLESRQARFAQSMVSTLGFFLEALIKEDPVSAIAELSRTMSDSVYESCDATRDLSGTSKCIVSTTSEDLERSFAVISAIVSYGMTYTTDGKNSNDSAEFRADQRKKAMEVLIESLTDRAGRSGEWVFSLGSVVGFAFAWSAPRDEEFKLNLSPLRLETGLSAQYLPAGAAWPLSNWGFHAQISVLDLAQYVAIRSEEGDVQTTEPGLETAIFFGGTLGALIGRPSAPILVGLFGGMAPGLQFEGAEKGAYVFGATTAIYIPFIDLN
jgi:hypothetical protein